MRALQVAIAIGLVACRKPAPPDEQTRKPRVDVTVVLDPHGEQPPDAVSVTAAAPPPARQMVERYGIHLAVVGVPAEGDPFPFLDKAIPEAEFAGSNATILVSTRCLKDLQLALEKNLLPFWTVALVIGARCDGTAKPRIAAAALVEAGSASRVRITFDRNTRAFLKIDPLP